MPMKLTELFLSELDREVDRSKRTLEQVPSGKQDFKPHERSMAFGYLTEMIATMPSWIGYIINQDELDIQPKDGPQHRPEPMPTSADLVRGLEKSAGEAKAALQKTSDDFLLTPWKLLVAGNVVMETPRHVMIRDTLNHLAHHRGQATVYLRLLGAKVPALYGPSADDKQF